MQVRDLLLALWRRWYLVLAVVLAAAGATVATVVLVGPTYEAKGATLLIPPGATVQQRLNVGASSGNPYLALSGLTQARDVVIRSVSAQATYLEICQGSGDARYQTMRQALCSARPGVSYEVTPDFESSAPVILVSVEADTADNAVTALNVVMARVPVALTALQSGLNLRPKTSITAITVMADPVPTVVRKDQIRAGVVAGGGVLALGILLIGLLDGVLATWVRRRRTSRSRAVPDWGTGTSSGPAWELPADGSRGASPEPAGAAGARPGDEGGLEGERPAAGADRGSLVRWG